MEGGGGLVEKDPLPSRRFPQNFTAIDFLLPIPGVSFLPTDVKDLVPWALPLKGPMVLGAGTGGLRGLVVPRGGTYAFFMSSADALRGTSRIS